MMKQETKEKLISIYPLFCLSLIIIGVISCIIEYALFETMHTAIVSWIGILSAAIPLAICFIYLEYKNPVNR